MPQTFAEVFGPGVIGSWLALGLYGVTTTQAYLYWIHYPKDSLWTKILVAYIWVLSTVHTICLCHYMYFHLINVESDPSLILRNVWSLNVLALFHFLTFSTVMLFYTRTIFIICSKKWRWWLTGAIGVTLIFNFAFGLDVTVRVFMATNLLEFYGFTLNTMLPTFALQLVSDIFVTGSLCILLYNKKMFSMKRTRNILNGLIIYLASRGFVTLVTDLVMVLAIAISPTEMWYSAPHFMITGLYANSLMVMLNARQPLSDNEECSHPTLQQSFRAARGPGVINIGRSNIEFVELGGETVGNNSQISKGKEGV